MTGQMPGTASWASPGGGGTLGNVIRLVSNTLSEIRSRRTFDRIITQKQMKNLVVYNVLKVAWARYGSVRMTEVDDRTMAFEFQSEKDKE